MRISRHPVAVASAALLMVASLGAQDAKKQTVSARGLSFEVPETWKKVETQSAMRALELKFGPAEGDKEAAEFVVFAFPGGAGTVQMNVERWQQQFQDENGKPPKITTKKYDGKNVEVTFVETAGRYVAPIQIGRPERHNKPGYQLLGAIVTTPEVGYFIKSVGPEKTMSEARESFIEMIESMNLGS